jgi:hypothetical protein
MPSYGTQLPENYSDPYKNKNKQTNKQINKAPLKVKWSFPNGLKMI